MIPVRAGCEPVRMVEWPGQVSVALWLWYPDGNTTPSSSRLKPPVKCWRYWAKRSAENWSTEMATTSLGGGRSAAAAGAARAAKARRAARRRRVMRVPLVGAARSTAAEAFGKPLQPSRLGRKSLPARPPFERGMVQDGFERRRRSDFRNPRAARRERSRGGFQEP